MCHHNPENNPDLPQTRTLEVEVGQGGVERIDVVAEISFLQQRVLHGAGCGGLQHLPPAHRGRLRRQRGVLRDAGLAAGLAASLPGRKEALRVPALRHQRAGERREALRGGVASRLLPPQQAGQRVPDVQSPRGGGGG